LFILLLYIYCQKNIIGSFILIFNVVIPEIPDSAVLIKKINLMKKIIAIALILTGFMGGMYSQEVLGGGNDVKSCVSKGIELHDKGDYKGAIEQYKKALKIDKKSPLANYEIASSYFALEEYGKSVDHADAVIDAGTDYVDQAYILKGSALDLMGKSKDAIKTYRKGIKDFPENHLLYYNLAYTLYATKEYKEAEEALVSALKIRPSHASSHLLLGYVMIEENKRVKSILALYNFLLLEPKSKRAGKALEVLNSQLKKGVKRDNEKSTTITISEIDDKDDFSAAELMISLLEASKNLETNEGKSEMDLFASNTKSLFTMLGELKKDNKGFWWNYYVDFFDQMAKDEHVETLCYYISQSKEDEKVNDWLKTNKSKVDDFSKWYKEYKRTF
jgi:Tfp pilus assembly protein PilF